MQEILSILKIKVIPLNCCYTNYELKEDIIIVKKSLSRCPSSIEVKELVDLYFIFTKIKDVQVEVCENGDVTIKKISKALAKK